MVKPDFLIYLFFSDPHVVNMLVFLFRLIAGWQTKDFIFCIYTDIYRFDINI